MRRMSVRLACVLLCSAVAYAIWPADVFGQRAADRTRPGGRTRQAQRDTPAPAASPAAPASSRNLPGSGQPAAQTQTQQAPSRPPVLERAEPELRAAFLELLGANWIWSPAQKKDEVPEGDCYFRKSFTVQNAEIAQVHITCDNKYELYVNGRLVGRGADWRQMDVHEVAEHLRPGTNVVAVKATNIDAGPAGLVARVILKEHGGTFESHSSDSTWRTSLKEAPGWTQPMFRDNDWLPAGVLGALGATLPWGDEIVIADEGSRFLIDREFVVERLIEDQEAGSLIAMAFNADGHILASREGGSLMLLRDTTGDGKLDAVTTFCGEVKNVQGILPLGSRVYAVGDGPAGPALYEIRDDNGDGRSDGLTALVRFRGQLGEHGPHTVRLGPDGLLYVLAGNFTLLDDAPGPRSPYGPTYEGDLVQPRYEDPQGYAVGVKAPGGMVLRTDVRGSFVELFAGGLRNPYDFAFNGDGELFTYDADMEWDIGAPWYRPTRINHVTAGGEFGWRSGWAKWPDYYLDSLPTTLDIGPGSPTGLVYYDHQAFPERLRNTLFVGDWALGHIHAIKLERDGASYKATRSTLLRGRPLNVTGFDVGPDGALYFCTGGRGTDGGVYRIRWSGQSPPNEVQFGDGVQAAIRQPQFHSDWARRRIAAVKQRLGDRWQPELERVIDNRETATSERLRAVDLLTLFGPPPSPARVIQLAGDRDPAMRAKAIRLMGGDNAAEFRRPLVEALNDSDAWVRRLACESIVRRGDAAPTDALVNLLADEDRHVAFAARRALEKVPAGEWQERVLAARNPRTFLQGATGLMVAHPSRESAQRVLRRCEAMLRGEVQEPSMPAGHLSDANFQDTLRVIQLALHRGQLAAGDVPSLTQQLVSEYPTSNALMNRELVKLLAYLGPPEAASALAQQLASDMPDVEKLQIAAYAPRISAGWQTSDKLVMLRYFEEVRGIEGGHSVSAYIEHFAREFFGKFTLAERRQVIAVGENFPTSALSILATLPPDPGADVLAEIRALDERVEGASGESIARLRVGIVAVLGRSGEPASMSYLRRLYLENPERRAPVAMSLTQNPGGENWLVLVDSLRTMEGMPAQEVLAALARVDQRPETSEPYRNAILLGLRLGANGVLATRLLEHWTGRAPYQAGAPVSEQLAAWQSWYANVFPNEPLAELPQESPQNRWTLGELASFLESPEGRAGSPSRGAVVFGEAQCLNCHRFNGRGEALGPDLTAVSQRFQRKEILESIILPSQVISDQYASQIVIANGRTYTGLVARQPDGGLVVLQSDGQKAYVDADDVEEVRASSVSSMPDGLLNPLSLEQIADLFAFLMNAPEPNVAGREPATAR